MASVAAAEPIPLSTDEDGVIRLSGTRVALETVILAFDQGATPEELAQDLPVPLSDLYAVITYYLRHPEAVREYLATRQSWADEMRGKVQARFDQSGFRERLKARLG